ncbi:sensor histidine kinase KdpD [Synechococcus sp. CCY 9618]|uniref:sensor histidine kinase n=1 Tax=Synechococcus sp. CCY 9618 TaxID=2815602 RepID=UPI001C244143|nr:HAMP domain-containing sensor histidine kinase [Synechococcus sp. CCY 9618]
MPVSERFLALVGYQLGQFVDCPEVRSLVVYVTHQGEEGQPSLIPVGHWPADERSLPPVDSVSRLRVPAEERRWLPLRDGQRLLGALQVETVRYPWPDPLAQRLQAVALALNESLRLDLEARDLRQRLAQRQEQLGLLLHQLRNPLTALRTFGHLLLRRMGPDHDNRSLVKGLLAEERQINRYVDAISELVHPDGLLTASVSPQPLLLPPLLSGPEGQPLSRLLEPLLQRAEATAALQGRRWQGPVALPVWQGDSGSVAEILANLLENAFRYSPRGAPVGLHGTTDDQLLQLTVWDGGPSIAAAEREAIFERGVRGERGQDLPGTGLGLALGRDLARSLGGDLELVVPPQQLDPALPEQGNAFRLSLPRPPSAEPRR